MLQVASEILSNPEDKTQVSLIFANQTEQDIILRDEIDQLASKHDNFQVIPPRGDIDLSAFCFSGYENDCHMNAWAPLQDIDINFVALHC